MRNGFPILGRDLKIPHKADFTGLTHLGVSLLVPEAELSFRFILIAFCYQADITEKLAEPFQGTIKSQSYCCES